MVEPLLRTDSSVPARARVQALFGPRLEFDKLLAPFTSFKTGGPARYFLTVTTDEELLSALQTARREGIPYFLIGGGSNLLISDSGYSGLIIKLAIQGLAIRNQYEIVVGAGEDLMALVNFSADHSLTGLEFASGIWGTVGGAIYGNAGAYGGEVKDVLHEVTLIDTSGSLISVPPSHCGFSYRDSALKRSGEVVVRAIFRLATGDRKAIRSRIDDILSIRREKHPDKLSAGSFFKNIPDPTQPYGKLPAGKLLEEVGAKSMHVGGARVYEKHANIIINGGSATAQDIRDLADLMKARVHEKFAILLEEEVISVGEFTRKEVSIAS